MKIKALVFLLITMFAVSASATKPEWAGKGKPTAAQKELRKVGKKNKATTMTEERVKGAQKKIEKEHKNKSNKLKGVEKQRQKKSTQIQKELDKGSERGLESREERKKWWNFFDN